MRKVSIAIVDDEAQDRDITKEMVYRFFASHTIAANDDEPLSALVTEYDSGLSVLASEEDHDYKPIDLLFLDIEMPGIDGLETAHRLRNMGSRAIMIFTTKMAQYATSGYDVDAIGYLVKPITYPSFALPMRKAMSIIQRQHGLTITVKSGDHLHFLDSNDIRYVEVFGHSVLYHDKNQVWKDWGTLKAAAEQLKPYHFVLSSRYCLINLEWVDAVDGNTVTVDGIKLTISRSRKKPLLEALTRHYRRH